MRYSSVQAADLTAAILDGADLRGADFTGARTARASFRDADIENAVGYTAE
jgi:uncharacterized protein YjbI with pentapeptide repeats